MTASFPAPQRRGPRVGLILGVIGLVAVLCTGGAGAALFVFRDRLTAVAEPGDYDHPDDICSLITGELGEQAGPVDGTAQLEDGGCLYTLAGELGTNELRVFVTADQAEDRFYEAGADFGNRDGFVGDVVVDLGDHAFFTRRLLDGGGLVDAKMGCLTRNLYIELRLHAASKRAWNSDDLRAKLTAFTLQIMQRVPRG